MKKVVSMKSWLKLAACASVLFVVGTACAQDSSAGAASPPDNEEQVLSKLWPVLQSSGKAGRLYYEAICMPKDNNVFEFPDLNILEPETEHRSVQSVVKSMFRKQPGFAISEDTADIIRIKSDQVPDAILRTRISSLRFEPEEQYTESLALLAIENAPDIRAAAARLNYRMPTRATSYRIRLPKSGLPHLPSEISNISFDQALDMVATTWENIVLFGACSKAQLFYASYAGPL
jgi:hypothetical protein